MIVQGVPINLRKINDYEAGSGSQHEYRPGRLLTDLPSYHWNHDASFWVESRVSRNIRFRKFPRHQLLGSRYMDDIPQRPCWRNQLTLKEIPWLARLKVGHFLVTRVNHADWFTRTRVLPSYLQRRIF